MSGYTIGSLFSGYGGLDMGVQLALGPARTAWVSDVDPGANLVLAHRFPDAVNLGDITKVDWTQVEPVDVITGGSPCQDVSHAGKRAGMKAGTRSGLWASMCDAIDIIRPRLVVWENVRGVLSAEADSALEPCPGCVGDGDDGPVLRALGRVLGDLADLGFDAGWCGLTAAGVGGCHGRHREFVVAWPAANSGRIPGFAGRITAPAEETRGRSLGDVARRGGTPLTLLPTPAVNDMGAGKTVDAWDAWTTAMQARHGNGNGHGASLAIEALRLLPTPDVAMSQGGHERRGGDRGAELLPPPRATDGTKGGPNQRGSSGDLMLPSAVHLLPTPTSTDAKASGSVGYAKTDTHSPGTTLTDATVRQSDRFGKYAEAIARHERTFGRTAPAPTRPDGKNGAHRLAPEFVEWMQALPAGWVTDPAIWTGWKPNAARNAQLALLGNGVFPAQASEAVAWVLDHVMKVPA